MSKPEALRLADALDAEIVRTVKLDCIHHDAAAELRRLHELNVDKTEIIAAISAQRDALLEALRTLLSYANVLEMRLLDADGEHRAMQQARAAIKAVEGEGA